MEYKWWISDFRLPFFKDEWLNGSIIFVKVNGLWMCMHAQNVSAQSEYNYPQIPPLLLFSLFVSIRLTSNIWQIHSLVPEQHIYSWTNLAISFLILPESRDYITYITQTNLHCRLHLEAQLLICREWSSSWTCAGVMGFFHHVAYIWFLVLIPCVVALFM